MQRCIGELETCRLPGQRRLQRVTVAGLAAGRALDQPYRLAAGHVDRGQQGQRHRNIPSQLDSSAAPAPATSRTHPIARMSAGSERRPVRRAPISAAGIEAASEMAVKGARVRAAAYSVGGVAPLEAASVTAFFAREDIVERRARLDGSLG